MSQLPSLAPFLDSQFQHGHPKVRAPGFAAAVEADLPPFPHTSVYHFA